MGIPEQSTKIQQLLFAGHTHIVLLMPIPPQSAHGIAECRCHVYGCQRSHLTKLNVNTQRTIALSIFIALISAIERERQFINKHFHLVYN